MNNESGITDATRGATLGRAISTVALALGLLGIAQALSTISSNLHDIVEQLRRANTLEQDNPQ